MLEPMTQDTNTEELAVLLLETVDCLREVLDELSHRQPPDARHRIAELQGRLGQAVMAFWGDRIGGRDEEDRARDRGADAEARAHAEEAIRHSPTPDDFRVVEVTRDR
jgi:hypothetical protein